MALSQYALYAQCIDGIIQPFPIRFILLADAFLRCIETLQFKRFRRLTEKWC